MMLHLGEVKAELGPQAAPVSSSHPAHEMSLKLSQHLHRVALGMAVSWLRRDLW